jgi:hypothetical protein
MKNSSIESVSRRPWSLNSYIHHYNRKEHYHTPLDIARSHSKSEEVWLYFLELGFFKTHGRDVVIAGI